MNFDLQGYNATLHYSVLYIEFHIESQLHIAQSLHYIDRE